MTTKKKTATKVQSALASHQWVDANGEVLIVRCADKNGRSYNQFQRGGVHGGGRTFKLRR